MGWILSLTMLFGWAFLDWNDVTIIASGLFAIAGAISFAASKVAK